MCVSNQAGLEMLRLVVREQAATTEAQAATIEALRVEQAAQCKSGFLTCMCMPLGHVHAIVTYVVHVCMRICAQVQ